MDFFELVRSTRAMRRLKPDPVPLDLLRQVIDAGVQAPSGMNSQPWAFVAVQDAAGKRFIAERYERAMRERFGAIFELDENDRSGRARTLRAVRYQIDHLHEIPVLLLVCGVRDWPFAVPEQERVGHGPPSYGAVYPCVQNMLLACRALGLGATLTTMHQLFEAELHERFAIPESHGIVVIMPIGYPLGRFGPVTRKPGAASTHFDRFGAQTLTSPEGLVADESAGG